MATRDAIPQAPLPTVPLRAWATLVPWRLLSLASHQSPAPGTSKPTDLDNLRLGEAGSWVALLTFMVKARSDTEVLLRLERSAAVFVVQKGNLVCSSTQPHCR